MSPVPIPVGRERRRKDLANRLRRAVFGLLLACGASHSQAFAILEPFDRDLAVSDANSLGELGKRYLRLTVRFRNFDYYVPDRSLFIGQTYDAPRSGTGHALAAAAAQGVWDMTLSADDFNRLRDGQGLDLRVPALGALRLNFRAAGASAPGSIARGWFLGGSFEQVRILDGGREREIMGFVPQLVLDLAPLTPTDDRLNLTFQYANWHSLGGFATEDRQPQLLLKWSF